MTNEIRINALAQLYPAMRFRRLSTAMLSAYSPAEKRRYLIDDSPSGVIDFMKMVG